MLERRLGLSDLATKTTPKKGSTRWRFASVTRFNYTIIVLLVLVNLAGAWFCLRPRRASVVRHYEKNRSALLKGQAPMMTLQPRQSGGGEHRTSGAVRPAVPDATPVRAQDLAVAPSQGPPN